MFAGRRVSLETETTRWIADESEFPPVEIKKQNTRARRPSKSTVN